jgi:hypothetical protein
MCISLTVLLSLYAIEPGNRNTRPRAGSRSNFKTEYQHVPELSASELLASRPSLIPKANMKHRLEQFLTFADFGHERVGQIDMQLPSA